MDAQTQIMIEMKRLAAAGEKIYPLSIEARAIAAVLDILSQRNQALKSRIEKLETGGIGE